MLALLLASSLMIASELQCPIISEIHEQAGQYEAETKQIAKSLKGDSDQSDIVKLAERHRTLGNYKAGLKLLDPLLEKTPNDQHLQKLRTEMALQRINRSSLFSKLGAAKKMRKACETDLGNDPKNSSAMLCLAQFFGIAPGIAGGSKSRRDDILTELKEVDLAKYHLARVNSGAVTERGEQIEALKEALKHDDSPDIELQLAAVYAANEDWQPATRILTSLAETTRGTKVGRLALYQIGRVAAQSGTNLEPGWRALKEFLEGTTWISGNNLRDRAFAYLAEIYSHSNCPAGRKQALTRALEVNPKNKDVKKALRALK